MLTKSQNKILIDAQYQAVTLSDALEVFHSAELHIAGPMLPMMADRLAALVYLIQNARTGIKPENYDEIIADARKHDAT